MADATTLRFAGDHNLTSASTVTGAGAVDFYSGMVNVDGSYNVTGSTSVDTSAVTVNFNTAVTIGVFNLGGGTLSGSANVTAAVMNWTGGSMTGTGKTTIPVGGTLAMNNPSGLSLTQRTLENNGTATHTAGTLWMRTGAVVNSAGTWNVLFDGGAFTYSGSPLPTFNNTGAFAKTGGTGTTGVGVPFNNSGTINVPPGTLSFISASAFSNLSGGILQGTGTLNVSGATFTNNGTINPGTAGTAGQLAITGALPNTNVVNIDIGGTTVGTQYDQLAVSGAATLGGALNVALINAFNPNVDDNFTIMTYPSKIGTFSSVTPEAPLRAGVECFLQTDFHRPGRQARASARHHRIRHGHSLHYRYGRRQYHGRRRIRGHGQRGLLEHDGQPHDSRQPHQRRHRYGNVYQLYHRTRTGHALPCARLCHQ